MSALDGTDVGVGLYHPDEPTVELAEPIRGQSRWRLAALRTVGDRVAR